MVLRPSATEILTLPSGLEKTDNRAPKLLVAEAKAKPNKRLETEQLLSNSECLCNPRMASPLLLAKNRVLD